MPAPTIEELLAQAKCLPCIPTGMDVSVVIGQFMVIAGMTDKDIQTLISNASCVDSCVPRGLQMAVLIALVQQITGNTSTPAELMASAKCINQCIPPGMLLPVLIALGGVNTQRN